MPYLAGIIIFLLITIIYFSPLLEGKKLKQHDIAMFKGMSKEIVDFREATGEEALWTNSMFGGMPAYQISVKTNGNLMRFLDQVFTLWLPYPASYVFLYFLGFFILLLVLRVNPWVSIVGAIAFALSSYFFIILGAGHTSKAHAIGYMAPVLAGIILTYRGKYWQGALFTAVALALEIKASHLQITYYLLLIVLVYGLYQLINTIIEKNYSHFFKATSILFAAAGLAVLTHSTNLWSTYEYGQETMRGKPELTHDQENKSSGLDRDYITNWSYGIGETWSLMIPNAKGGASGVIGQIKALDKAERVYQGDIAKQNHYWGDQPGTSGPVYVGVIVFFFFILGMFIVEDKIKWALLAVTILSVMLGWGKNMMWFTDLFIDYMPGYNKFRAVSMTLVIAELTIPLLAFMAFGKLIAKPEILKKNLKPLYYSFGLTGGLILLFYALPTTFFSFFSQFEAQQFNQMKNSSNAAQIEAFLGSLESVRVAIFRMDALRSLLFVSLAAGLVFAFVYGKVNKTLLIVFVGVLILIDMVGINRRYLNNDNFVRAQLVDVPFKPSKADLAILKDTDPDFRVLDLTTSTFNDATASYFHKSIGGYHGAKLQRYQDLIEGYINDEIMVIVNNIKGQITQVRIEEILSQLQVLNMLNTRYIIFLAEMNPVPNENAFGNAWFVKNIVLANDPDEEFARLGNVDLKQTAVVDKRFESQIKQKTFMPDSAASIQLTSYAPNHLTYEYNASQDQVAVFSEIYYEKGWNAYIDGEQVPYFRANYVLRAMNLPAGKHIVDFKFEPKVYAIGEKVSFASSLLLILLLIGALVYEGKKYFTAK